MTESYVHGVELVETPSAAALSTSGAAAFTLDFSHPEAAIIAALVQQAQAQ